MKKKCSVYDGCSPEAEILWLTPAEIVEYRRAGYYVIEME